MLQHLAKWALFAALWRRASPYLVGSFMAAVMALAVTAVHAEFLDYVRLRHELQGPESNPMGEYLSLSFVIKWLCYGAIALGYAVYWVRRSRTVHERKEGVFPRRSPPAERPSAHKGKSVTESKAQSAERQLIEDDDAAFDFLRGKRRLRGRSQQLLERDRDAS